MIQPKSNDTQIKELLEEVSNGRMQLPEFQRNWTWDDNRIKGIIASIAQGYPMGAIMRLQYGNDQIKFKYRMLEGVNNTASVVPEYLILDGQQRMTSIYNALYSKNPVKTKTEKNKQIDRFYYIDINKYKIADDLIDAIVSVPSDKKVKTNFDRDIQLDLSSRDLEYQNEYFPLNIIFDNNEREDWADGYKDFHDNSKEIKDKYKEFRTDILDTIVGYMLPVIGLDKSTPREAVCRVFENVNTGGVALTVFELVTATFATYDFNLREDWQNARAKIICKGVDLTTDLLDGVDETSYLTTITLYTTYMKHRQAGSSVSCKKKDVLSLEYADYCKYKDAVIAGYGMARRFLLGQYIFRKKDMPYNTQIIPLVAICAYIGSSTFDKPETREILSKWFWCGILGEMYGGANETRYANDIEDVIDRIEGVPSQNRTYNAASFASVRLLSLQTRQSAAYKGIMALIYKDKCLDFLTGDPMDIIKSVEESPDIHHIFPEDYCKKQGYDARKWNSIVNKTPLFSKSNRAIGGVAPSKYINKILSSENSITDDMLEDRIKSHFADYELMKNDDFDKYIVARAKCLLALIEKAMGKAVSDKSTEDTVDAFGEALE